MDFLCYKCIHTISLLCRVRKRDAEISGAVDKDRACQLITVNIIFTSRQLLAVADH